MDDAAGGRCDLTEVVDVCHDFMAQFAFEVGDAVEVDPVDGGSHLLDGRVADVEAQLALGLGEGDPELTPDAGSVTRAEDPAHLRRRVPADQGVLELVLGHCVTSR